MKIETPETLTKMSDSKLDEYIGWIEDERLAADFKDDALEAASYYLSAELRQRDW